MSLSKEQIEKIEDILRTAVRHQLENYKYEPESIPFHTRLLGEDRMALYSFIQFFNSSIHSAIFELVAVVVASAKFRYVKHYPQIESKISADADEEIEQIIYDIDTDSVKPNAIKEIERLRHVCQSGGMISIHLANPDLAVKNLTGESFLFEIATKPRLRRCKKLKRKLLQWAASVLAIEPDANINTAIALPYRSNALSPYAVNVLCDVMDSKHQLYIGDKFWDFLGGKGTYATLLNIFEKIGNELSREIDSPLLKFR